MENKRVLLIVDDIKSNREILKNMLGNEYSIIEAEHGKEAIAIMAAQHKDISVVLLDLGMPVMDGYEVLSYMQDIDVLKQLPVIVTTGQTDSGSEEKALRLGAKDYITKPYKSAIIKQRILNTIILRETSATVNALQRDRLTGLYSRDAFFDKVQELVSTHEAGYYTISSFDIEKFKVINDQYGNQKGDEALRHIASVFRNGFDSNGGFCCRISADDFVAIYPTALQNSKIINEMRKEASTIPGLSVSVSFTIGCYVIKDTKIPPSAMYDRAILAANSIKGRYDIQMAVFDESMRNTLIEEQQVISEMESALENNQFEIWYQPQYNHSNKALIGAEALIRWRHPTKGLIPPGVFIPIFEKNGFIYQLDKFVWDGVCKFLRNEMDTGRSPLPISVNISRYDVFKPDFFDYITGLIGKYHLSVDLLRLEITESAFSENTKPIVQMVKKLIAFGFMLEIDDFGSGYSSLNTLKNVPAQIIKLDMRFFENDDDSERGGNIVESVIRMTKWLGISVIAEGVEEREQADFLKSIGCNYIQGYLYSKPIPEADYQAVCDKSTDREKKLLSVETVDNLDNNSFWNPKSMDTLIFNSYVGAACIFEYINENIELLRVSPKFVKLISKVELSSEDALKLDWAAHLEPDSKTLLHDSLEQSKNTRGDVSIELTMLEISHHLQKLYLRCHLRVIATSGTRYLVYCLYENITEQKEAERELLHTTEQLQTMMNDIPGGFSRLFIDNENNIKIEYVNSGLCHLLDMPHDEIMSLYKNDVFAIVHTEDVQLVKETIEKIFKDGDASSIRCRLRHKTNGFIWLSLYGRSTVDAFGNKYLNIYYTDATKAVTDEERQKELLDNLSYGVALYEYDGKSLSVIHLNNRYWELIKRKKTSYSGTAFMDALHPDDRTTVLNELSLAIRENRTVTCNVRILCGKDEYQPFNISGRIVRKNDGNYAIYATYVPITKETMSIQEMLPIALGAVMNSQSDYTFVKNKNLRYICCSLPVAKLAGCNAENDIVGKSDHELFDKEIADAFYKDDMNILKTGESFVDNIDRIPSKDGSTRYACTSKFPLRDAHGNVVGVYGVGRDITEARSFKSRFELLANSIPGGIATYEYENGKLNITYFNDGFCRLFDTTPDTYKAIGLNNPMFGICAEYLPELNRQLDELLHNNVQIDCIYRIQLKNGTTKWINLKADIFERIGDKVSFNAVLLDITQRQNTIENMRISEEENRLAIQHTQNIVCRYNVEKGTLNIPEKVRDKYSFTEVMENIPESQIAAGLISTDTIASYTAFYNGIRQGNENGMAIFKRLSKVGWRWIEGHFSTIFSTDGTPVSAVISFSDITSQMEKDIGYRRWKQSFADKAPDTYSLFRYNLSNGKYIEQEGSLVTFNEEPSQYSFNDYTEKYIAKYVFKEDAKLVASFLKTDALLANYFKGEHVLTLDYREPLSKDTYKWVRLTVDMVDLFGSADIEACLLFEDIDKEKKQELATIEKADTDPLTGVLNRNSFAIRVNNIIKTSKPNTNHAFLMLDMDGFKRVNDSFGHKVGDQAIIDIADAIRSVVKQGDLIGRLGGDEFIIFLPHISEDIAATKAQKLCAIVRKTYSIEVELSCSVGIAIAPKDGTDFDTLYKKADLVLYYVKGSGKNSYAFYKEDMSREHLVHHEEEGDPNAHKKRRMLIVDDSRIDYAMLSNLFSNEFIIEKASNGNAALIGLRHYGSAISVVLLDLMMPIMDGFTVLKRMRENPDLQNIPVVVVSGDENRETSLRAIREGAVDFVGKPIDPEILRIRVHSAISRAENARLRAKTSLLEYQNDEILRYKTALEASDTFVVENNWIEGTFVYDKQMSQYIAGKYDNRGFWQILLSDFVAETATVQKMQHMVQAIASDRTKHNKRTFIQLRTPDNSKHWFGFIVQKMSTGLGLAGKIYMIFTDHGIQSPTE